MLKHNLCLFLLVLFTVKAFSQSSLLPISNLNPHNELQKLSDKSVHTAMQPILLRGDTVDSLLYKETPVSDWQGRNWLFRKIFLEHFVEVKTKEYEVSIDFIPDVWIGRQGSRTVWNNTREVAIIGRVGDNLSFTSSISENQGVYPSYYDSYVRRNKIVPGQGHARIYGEGGFDYSNSSANVSYSPSAKINFQVGYGKNFVGNGYRSLLLSDFSFNYPFFKITANLGSVQYSAMWAQMGDLYDITFNDETPFDKKYGVFHFLDWNVNNRLSIGLFENIMWEPRGGEWSYFVPVLFLRPVEYNNGSPDKVLIGLNGSYKVNDKMLAYGQVAINEFTLKQVFSGSGYWANKFGGQIGLRAFDMFNVSNLDGTFELNSVRPYTYSASKRIKNYGHYNEPLAHPLGANFREYLGILSYKFNRWQARVQGNFSQYGLDMDGLNYGKNIYLDYTTRVDEYGVEIGHGLKTNLFYANTNLAYLLNPKNNLRLELGYTYRKESNDQIKDKQQFVTFGLKASFRNKYQDF